MWRRASLYVAACAAAAGLVAACNQSVPGLEGFDCASDGDCGNGLKCLPYFGLTDGGVDGGLDGGSEGGSDGGPVCFSSGTECLVPCHSDSDCTKPLVCFTSCGASACEAP
ncbi:MAG: hypothetical protein ACRENE_04905 [Polyangiaceae bacterium]